MAIANADGSIILTTKVEDSGLKRGMEKIISEQKTKLQSLTREYAKLITNNQQNTEEAKKLKKEIDNLSKSIKQNETILKSFGKSSSEAFEQTSEAVENSSKSFSGFQSALKSIAGYLALAFSVTKIIQFSNESASLATQTEASVQRLVDIYGSASDSVGDFIDQNARALGMSKAAAASFSSVYGNLFSVWADQETNAELTNRYLNMTAVVASKTGRTVEDVQERVRSGLLGNTEAIEDLGIFVNVKTIEMTDAFQRMAGGKSWEQLDAYTQQQIRSMAILEQATAKYGDEVADTSATIRNRFNAAYQDFQNSWGNIVNTVLLPVLETLTQIFDIATKGLNVLSGRSGQILEDAEGLTDNSEDTAENIEEQTKNQKELNDELKKSLAGFDDIQILSAQTAQNTQPTEFDKITTTGGGDTTPDGSAYVEEINKTLTAIMAAVAVSMIAIGLILLFTGNIAWGLGTIIFGVALEGVTMAAASQTDFGQDIIQAILTIQAVASGALLAIGIMLLYIGDIVSKKVAIGMIIAGGISLIGSVGALIGLSPTEIENWLSVITGIASGSLLALGIILCIAGSVPLGLKLIIAGAGSLVSAITLNSNAFVDWIKKMWKSVTDFWNTNIAPVFTYQWWANLAIGAGNGLIAGFEAIVNSIIIMFETMFNFIIDGINSISFDIPDWLGGGHFGFDIERVSWDRVSWGRIPKLAQGAVIPGNREFLAVLGDQPAGQTNIEAPLQTIVDAFNIALNNRGNDTVKEEHYYLDENEIMRIIYKLAKRGEQAQGADLIESW